ncbi:MAG: hypothetical protein R3230_00735 [Nitrosopumilaceae archaeon]|nr:hypothetical protein [Nitrosopumilaceae archaeon]
MSSTAKLLMENSYEVETLTEKTENGKELYIHGIFAQAEVKNGNGRFYKRDILEKAVAAYNEKYVSQRRALGELNHPDRPFPDPAEAGILISEMYWEGNNVIGKAKVLNTPKGQIIKGLMEGGFNMGVSTRGLGSLSERGGMKYVNNDYMMTAVDCVDGPSGPNCFVNPLVESTWIQKNGVWVPASDINESVEEIDESIFLQKFEDLIKSFKK